MGGYRAENRDLDPRFDDQDESRFSSDAFSQAWSQVRRSMGMLNGEAGWESRANLR